MDLTETDLCKDGTWLDSASGLMQGKIPLQSNVTRIAQAIKPTSRDGISQVVYYQVLRPPTESCASVD